MRGGRINEGQGRSKTALMTPNIIEMPPMPNASVRTTTVVNHGFCQNAAAKAQILPKRFHGSASLRKPTTG